MQVGYVFLFVTLLFVFVVKISWKEGLATWKKYKAVVRGCRVATRKAKAYLELNLAKGVGKTERAFSNTLRIKLTLEPTLAHE